jgi:hypothetical protein
MSQLGNQGIGLKADLSVGYTELSSMNWMKRRAYLLGCIELILVRLFEIPCSYVYRHTDS